MPASAPSISLFKSHLAWLTMFLIALFVGTQSFLWLNNNQQLSDLALIPLFAALPLGAVLLYAGAVSHVRDPRRRIRISLLIILALPVLFYIPFLLRYKENQDVMPLLYPLLSLWYLPQFILYGMGGFTLPDYINGEYAADSVQRWSQIICGLILAALILFAPRCSPKVLRVIFVMFCLMIVVSMRGCTYLATIH